MKVLIDTNVILDIALEHQPFVEQAVKLLKAARQANIILYMTATTITDLYYIAQREKGHAAALDFIVDLLKFMKVAGVDEATVREALRSDITDFEDAIQESAAKRQAIQAIVTRNETDFKNSVLEIYNPETFLKCL